MITGTKEYLEGICQTHLCPEHGRKLVVAWHAQEDSFVLRCGEGHYPEEVTREMTPTQEYKVGQRQTHGTALDFLYKDDLGNGKALTESQVSLLIRYAQHYGLDAFRGHVMMMYGAPYIGIDGYLYHAYKTKRPFSLISKPISTEEKPAYQLKEGDHGWIAELVFTDTGTRLSGIGIVTLEEMTARSDKKLDQLRAPVVAAHPWQLAQKRAEWQALRRAFPIGEVKQNREET